jgi:hypothetical protein
MRTLVLLSAAILAVGCGGGDAGSFGSPEDAVKSFISAANAKDAEALSKCFSSTCQGEFKKLLNKTASAEDLAELAEMFKGASVGEAKTEGNSSKVEVKLPEHPRGSEKLDVVKEGDAWKIQGF